MERHLSSEPCSKPCSKPCSNKTNKSFVTKNPVHQHAASLLCLVKEGETHVLQIKRTNHYQVAQIPAIIRNRHVCCMQFYTYHTEDSFESQLQSVCNLIVVNASFDGREQGIWDCTSSDSSSGSSFFSSAFSSAAPPTAQTAGHHTTLPFDDSFL